MNICDTPLINLEIGPECVLPNAGTELGLLPTKASRQGAVVQGYDTLLHGNGHPTEALVLAELLVRSCYAVAAIRESLTAASIIAQRGPGWGRGGRNAIPRPSSCLIRVPVRIRVSIPVDDASAVRFRCG
jgi:hypothetical protein